jgi:hypothetical protein
MLPTTDAYLDEVVATAKPTPRSLGGLRLQLTVSLYAKGHSGLDAPGTGVPFNNDEELMRSIEAVVSKLRARM